MQDNRRSLMLGCTLELGQNGWLGPGGIHCFGSYFPKSMAEHRCSSWTQTVLKVKQGDAWVTMKAGEILAGHMEYWLVQDTEYVMTYVPRRPGPDRSTGTQQCPTNRLAHAIVDNLVWVPSVPLEALLMQVGRKPKRQRECATVAERAENVRGCYAVPDPEQVRDKNVIVVDDIVTTGATMRACGDALRQAGACSITGIALAQTVGDRCDPTVNRNQFSFACQPALCG